KISIHAPHAGSDILYYKEVSNARYFNPRSPCGERLKIPKIDSRGIHFNPRSPCGERHYQLLFSVQPFAFQSTLPMRGATHSKNSGINSAYSHFNPRSPCGERHVQVVAMYIPPVISIHAPHAG